MAASSAQPIHLHSPLAEAAHDLAVARKDILRIATAGSVDDGKSTLIGRLLYDSKAIFEDQYEAVERASKGDYVDLALLTDGLRAEREQGITIDVAYRYFTTPRRTFILADTPATCSTRGTWSPAPRPPTWRSSWSTPARGCSSRAAGTPSSPRCCGSRTSSSP